ncbi:hypothetical protein PN465_20210 [Nodularia spumigena CS-584]|jgi:hypothetical protein|uniref:Uncharacterized protein n=1 Tax=Nodularia spumigena UHCC 0060 TaxID=3110300 RepID=A0ABU5USI2_NODSP|nr:hypothetical protein [Nodularia spumigena]EAW45868.1 hypothetical protein N9414_15737 [Nodularia spumigena CCY9414]MDB9384518.1 hypothetical protein [Nodularia spumigena CS-584]MEA5525132.1 hypothetical protein [Nodularia spumigena UHCC 0143]MEA5558834.1 hypothetical protein [Nodularia spumigena CH309]MEA5609244.1 hypothetical protein [Nodularia spumigena UHCC 0060]
MIFFFDILKVSSVIETWNSHWNNRVVFRENDRKKPEFSLVGALVNFRLAMYCDASQLRKTEFGKLSFFDPRDKKQYKTKFKLIVISLWRPINFGFTILDFGFTPT